MRPVILLKPSSFLILLNDPLCIGFMYANYLVERSSRWKIYSHQVGWVNYPLSQQVINKCIRESFTAIIYSIT